MTTIPRTLDDVTADWLSDVLDRSITGFTTEPVGVGIGLVGQLHRLTLEGDCDPKTLIAKFSAPTDEGRFVATVLNMYGREVGFYNELSPHTRIPHPQCFYAAHDAETQDSILLLEDVSTRGAMLDQIEGVAVDEAGPALRTLAQLHAGFWGDDSLGDHAFLLRLADEPYPGAVQFAYATAWPNAQEFFPDQMNPQVKAYGDAFEGRIAGLFTMLCDGPHVLSHADWRADNLFLSPQGEIIAVDWQLIDRSVGPRDVSYFVTQSVNANERGDYEKLFDIYLDELGALGVTPDRDWAWEMYRYGAAMAFVYPIVAAGALTVEDPRHIEITGAMLRRSIRALEALDAFDLPL
jgi:Ecdysteroid kinase-like family